MSENKAILDSTFIVPSAFVPLPALEDFKETIKSREGEPINFQFYRYDPLTDNYHFARGDLDKIKKHFGHLEVQDLRAIAPMFCRTLEGGGLQFTGELRKPQLDAANLVLHGGGFGQVNCPPRFGKTITLIYIVCALRLRCIWLVHQIDLCQQALKSFRNFTNVLDLEYIAGRKIVDLVEDWDDLSNLDVAILPYQRFIRTDANLQKLQDIKDKFGIVVVDECHRSSAPRYQEVVEAFNSRFRIGMSGTTERKDQMHVVNQYILGPVKVRGATEQLPCEVRMVRTGVKIPYRPTGASHIFFVKMLNFLSKSKPRNKLIIDMISEYAKAGHTVVAVTDRVNQIDHIVEALVGMGIPAEAFHRKKFANNDLREACLNRVRSGQTQVLIMMRSMTTGIDIPRATAFFNLLPTANGPSYYQEFCRVRTPFENKNKAYIVDLIDDSPVAAGFANVRRKLYIRENFVIHE